jgi:chaperonin GroES
MAKGDKPAAAANLRPLDDRVVVEAVDAEEKTTGGILLPDTAKQKPQRGRVIAAGPGKLSDAGERLALSIKVGDEVLFGKYSGSDVEVGNKEYKILRESELLAKVTK